MALSKSKPKPCRPVDGGIDLDPGDKGGSELTGSAVRIIRIQGQPHLLQIALAIGDLGFLANKAQSGQQHRGENADDRHHHQQLDQGEGFRVHASTPLNRRAREFSP